MPSNNGKPPFSPNVESPICEWGNCPHSTLTVTGSVILSLHTLRNGMLIRQQSSLPFCRQPSFVEISVATHSIAYIAQISMSRLPRVANNQSLPRERTLCMQHRSPHTDAMARGNKAFSKPGPVPELFGALTCTRFFHLIGGQKQTAAKSRTRHFDETDATQ